MTNIYETTVLLNTSIIYFATDAIVLTWRAWIIIIFPNDVHNISQIYILMPQ